MLLVLISLLLVVILSAILLVIVARLVLLIFPGTSAKSPAVAHSRPLIPIATGPILHNLVAVVVVVSLLLLLLLLLATLSLEILLTDTL